MVLDRLFLWIFTMAVVVGTAGIILQAPSLYDDRSPIDKELSDIGQQVTSLFVWSIFVSLVSIGFYWFLLVQQSSHIQLTPLVSCFRMGIGRTLRKSVLEELEPHADDPHVDVRQK